MSALSIAPPENLQVQSPLARLPIEIKHIIFGYCFAADSPIVDPVVGYARPSDEVLPVLGLNVLQACRRLYHEADRRPLFAQNTFRFTTVDYVRGFLRSLGVDLSASVQDIEIDARRVHTDHPEMAREWLQYLAWDGGPWAKTLGSLRQDAPKLKCLRLNFQSWPLIPMLRTELWSLLRSMLEHVEGLERIVVIGASKGSGMARREPWSSVHFVGGDDVGSNDLVPRMWKTVKGADGEKVIRWTRNAGKLYLEVASRAYLVQEVDRYWAGLSWRKSHTDPWPQDGSCSWFAYQNRDKEISEPLMKSINPSAVE